MTDFRGIGNFSGDRKGCPKHSYSPLASEPVDKYGRPLIQVDGAVAQIACRLSNRDGYWPGWFLWAVGSPPPSRFLKEASRLAMREATGKGSPSVFVVAPKPALADRGGLVPFSQLPPHDCIGGRTLHAMGRPTEDNSIVCSARRWWVADGNELRQVDERGCGKVFVLDHWGRRVER